MILSSDILQQFTSWFDDAKQRDATYCNGMSVATVDEQGQPSNRIVLLKSVDEEGFTFFTNYNSRKGDDIVHNSKVAATFWWSAFQRQIRIEGVVRKTTRQESVEYFSQRPLLSQVAAVISDQSQPVASFEALQAQFDEGKACLGDNVTCPDHWGGYRIDAHHIEFWQGKDHRLHERQLFEVKGDEWVLSILQP
ncbi:pyridoxamine 5'-phosphate oxidase [Gammaproteobacteria bacterium 42_54_T18]|nr:pyridoxamine 5'-phosphate oxidase [Gammaproteobacteria bacterium 42_54_T18]